MSSPTDRQRHQLHNNQGQETPRTIASNNFLSLLREHGNFGRTVREEHHNDNDTVNADDNVNDGQYDQQGGEESSSSRQSPQQTNHNTNEDTIRAGNTDVHKRTTSALSDLFAPPPTLPLPLSRGIQAPSPESSATIAVASLYTRHATTTSPIPNPGILPRTSMEIEGIGSNSIPKVDSTGTLNAGNQSAVAPPSTSTTTSMTTRLPPRPPPVNARDQSVFYTSSPYASYNDDESLEGEGIMGQQDSIQGNGHDDTNIEKNEKHFIPATLPHASSMSPITQHRVEEGFLHPASRNNSDGTSPESRMPRQQPMLSPSSSMRKPDALSNRARSVSFGQHHGQQQPQQLPQQHLPHHHQSNPSLYSAASGDVILNNAAGLTGGDRNDYVIAMEPNMLHHGHHGSNSNNNEPHHHRDQSSIARRKRLQSDATRTINLDDLLSSGPYEMEAETNILKALEEKQPRHRRYTSETSTILSGVPENLAHDFSLEEPEVTNVPPLVDGSQEEVYSSSFHGSADDGDPMSHTPPPPPPPLVDMEEEMPLLKVDKKPNRLHRRTMSVEDRLAGLTIEYSNLEERKTVASASSKAPDNNNTNNNVSSGDAFRQNTAVIARMDENNSPGTRNRKYTDFSDKLPAVEEDDEESPPDGTQDGDSRDGNAGGNDANTVDSRRSRRKEAQQQILIRAADHLKDELEVWRTFFSPRRENVKAYFKFVCIYMGIPLIGAAVVLYYAFGNPPTDSKDAVTKASASWWLLFCMRQAITLSCSLFLQLLVIDFLSVGTRVMLRVVGPILTLLIVQSRGWPFVFFWWSILNFALIQGDRELSRHWLFWQDYIGLLNSDNPSGDVVTSFVYTRVLILAAVISLTVAIKRFVVGLWLSRNTFNHYGAQLAKVMNKMVLVSQVAQLAKKLHKSSMYKSRNPYSQEAASVLVSNTMKRIYSRENLPKEDDQSTSSSAKCDEGASGGTKTRDTMTDALDDTQRMKLFQLLEIWEEPDRISDDNARVSISAVLRFRNALNLIQNDHAFSLAFGPTHSREACIQSSQETYRRLLSATPGEQNLHFETLGLVTVLDEAEIDQEKAKDLVKVFRPRRDGILTMLDFVKSTDSVYKEFRLLQASIQNSSQIDIAFENILNIFFYAILITIILSILGFDPLSLFLSLSSIILGFAFMIGSASSKYFEGILFILVRRPYGIGDIIHISNTELETNPNGSIGWIVQKVSLFETVATWVPTLEKASFNNGSLASSRVINWRRSPNAKVNIQLHFPIETKYEQIEIFKRAVEEFMKVRPREWLQLNGFRVNRILTEQSYMQVTLLIQHRDSWQNIAQILDSKSNMVTYCSEVQKKLGMQYKAPALPVDLRGAPAFLPVDHASIAGGSDTGVASEEDPADVEARLNYFRLIAKTRHQIRAT